MVKIGVTLPSTFEDAGEYLAEATALEAAGADGVWVGEALTGSGEQPGPAEMEPLTLLAAVAASTHRVRLGAAVTMAGWPAALFAAQVATVDHLSRGRVVVGLGGEPRLDESIELIRRAWADRCVQPGGPPILLSGSDEAGYQRAARLADGFVCGSGREPEAIAALFDHVQELRRATGQAADLELWLQVERPESRPHWRELTGAAESAGATGIIVPWTARLIDLLRNPDPDEDRSDLRIAQG